MLAERLERPFARRCTEGLKRLGITTLTLPLVAFIYVILLFLAAAVGWVWRLAVESAR